MKIGLSWPRMDLSKSNSAAVCFRELMDRPDEEIDLAEAALLVAKSVYPDLDVARYLGRIDQFAQQLNARLPDTSSNAERIVALNRYLFDEQGFAPSIDDYYDLRNSFLNDVLERRVGIPIALSILYIEVGRRIGLPLQGVSFPGHFLVKCKVEEGVAILDPYGGGVSLGLHELQQRLRAASGGEVSRPIVVSLLVSATKKQIMVRVLRNLEAIYVEQRDHDRALSVMDWILSIAPADVSELRARGLLYMKLECFRAALEDLECYVALAPAADDSDRIRAHVAELRKTVSRLN